ncbi:S9 family peptidase [Xanthomonas hortorum]|uniref:Dipeptidyl aminopeptidase 4 n=1 Tax=Xanthomonas hortorum pv. pelargonii TaxID=453602 RepID=A0A6V7CRT4_9XANT|nr:S9 family peptidase [Xanthomonas hortorum]MCE4354244.1 S9 family peptidase [Xanthomonas hortorum pv. pelargonii]MCM5523100.1 S9 family peptidase [Xanthomonas hortorum pv. pelargonii]MCM5537876.1 S9 family peptidase [Xanthomonas hortorum pv. pelargonii]MCM5539598.1 S9 family peptidase [Xanthomonas hortorum pv. pelargonii]MCM5545498.1 S9 family peptidase [Xanthomonas hortorum pv. pelargonii]
MASELRGDARVSHWLRGCWNGLAACILVLSTAAQAAPSVADYQRSLGLREQWSTLTENVAWPAQWKDSGAFYYRKTVPGGFAFVSMDVATLQKKPAFDQLRVAQALQAATGKTYTALQLPFERFAYAQDGEGDAVAIRFELGEEIWRCTLTSYRCARDDAGTQARPRGFGVVRDPVVPADNMPRRSPDGRWEALADGWNLVLRRVSDGQLTRLSTDGRAEDYFDPESIAWSPDSQRLAVYRVRPGLARRVTRVEAAPAGGGQPVVRTQLYPKPGDAVDVERPVVFAVDGTRQDVETSLFANPYVLSPLQWRSDGRSVSFDYVQRGFQRMRVITVDAQTGRAHVAVGEDTSTFVYADRSFRHEVNGRGDELLWISERDGWRHLYLINGRSGKPKRQLTHGAWIVRDVLRVDDAQRRIWFTASGMDARKDPYYRQLYSVDFDGHQLTRLTHTDADHDVTIAEDGRHYVDVYSRPDLPPVMELHAINGRLLQQVEQGNIDKLLAAGWRAPETFVAKGRDGRTDIWGMVVRPRDYDPSKKYPVIENIYAGPHDSFVPKTFWPFGYHSGGDKQIGMQAQADLGFIVVMIDGMGTANRSKAFHDVAWKNLGDSGFPDRIAWHRALAAKDPSYDIGRVGIYGASAGGQSTLGALERHPEFYKVGVAFAGCYDNRMDKISWNEQWMGWPVDASYAQASGVVNAATLQGDLLLIVGEQDSNVDPASTAQVVDALIKSGKDFDLLNVPGGEHSVGRSSGPIDYVQRRQYDFFVRHLRHEPTLHWNSLPSEAR